MNTRFGYMYRDACNYKTFNEIVVAGVLAEKDIEPYLRDKTYFIPSEIKLIDLQEEVFTVNDHIWHEIEFLSSTTDDPTTDITAEELINNFRVAHQSDWNEYDVCKRKGLI